MTDIVVNRHALPDWYPCRSVAFVYPYKLKGREHLIPFYDKLFLYIPDDIGIQLVVKDDSFKDEFLKKCRDTGINNIIEFLKVPDISDIWIRDFAPLTILEGELMTAWQFEYAPSYVDLKYGKYLQSDHKAGEQVWKHIYGYGVNSAYFKWDLGNLTHNGNGTAIVTNRLIADNQEVSIEHELKPMLNVFTGFKDLIFIPTEPDDVTGHVDGMVRFIDEKTLVVGAYPEGGSGSNFMDTLAENLQKDLGEQYTIIRHLNGEPEDFETECVGSAVGNHMNYLRLGDKILIPYYGNEISGKAIEDFRMDLNRINLNIEVISVDMPEILDLARCGGVLNCISWQVYK